MRERPSQPGKILTTYMADRGLKTTRQRHIILQTFLQARGHISVDEVLARARQLDARISTATVYRTMKLLTECGLARAQNFEDGLTRYEPTADREHHDHLICTACGTIVEFENPRIEQLQQASAREHGFELTHHKMELYGLCRACQRAGAAARSVS